jgi:thiazolinyl imide reductase
MTSHGSPTRVLVCGTTFGQVYLEAFRQPSPAFELVGILGQGSERSKACAGRYGVPLFTSVESLPEDIDIACVVVRGGVLGGPGSELAKRLMARRIHVLQEHPVHHDELAECLRAARSAGVSYRLNSFYPHLPVLRRFIRVARTLLSRRKPLYFDAACSMQVCYALFDVLSSALREQGRPAPVRPWEFSASPLQRTGQDGEAPFLGVQGLFAGIPVSLRLQNQIDPSDPDDCPYLLHRLTLGTEAGELHAVSTHGPLVWTTRPALPREVRNATGQSLYVEQQAPDGCDAGTRVLYSRDEAAQHVIYRSDWPQAALHALLDFRDSIQNRENPASRGQHDLALCRVWQDLAGVVGPPRLVMSRARADVLSSEELTAMEHAASEDDGPAASPQASRRPDAGTALIDPSANARACYRVQQRIYRRLNSPI